MFLNFILDEELLFLKLILYEEFHRPLSISDTSNNQFAPSNSKLYVDAT